MRVFLELSYLGTNYHGWQRQTNSPSVQEEIEKALSVILKQKVEVAGCGRTDAGVHATKFFLHFDAPSDADLDQLIYSLNGILGKDIAIYGFHKVKEDAHTRFDAIARSYEYHIHFLKDPFLNGLSVGFRKRLDFNKMNKAAELLLETEEFGAFCKAGSENKTDKCDVTEAVWKENGTRAIFHITANRFLRNMVRAIVGTLVEVGQDKISIEEFHEIIKSQNRTEAGASVPAHGLYLTDIKYPYL